MSDTNDYFWNELTAREGMVFKTGKGKEFTFHVRKTKHGEPLGEIEIDRKRIVISRVTAMLAYHQAQEVQEKKGFVKGPGKLGTHGAVYMYPILIDMGICSSEPGAEPKASPMPAAEAKQVISEKPAVKCCPDCGYTTEEDFEFCPKCGRKF